MYPPLPVMEAAETLQLRPKRSGGSSPPGILKPSPFSTVEEGAYKPSPYSSAAGSGSNGNAPELEPGHAHAP